MKGNFRRGLHRIGKSIIRRAPLLASVGAAVGICATAGLSVYGARKASEILEDEFGNRSCVDRQELSLYDEVKTTWKCYIPAGISMAASIALCFLSHGLSAKQVMALSASNTMLAGALNDLKEGIKSSDLSDEKIGEIYSKAEERRRSEKLDIEKNAYILDPNGTLFYDAYTRLWFRQDYDAVKNGIISFNEKLACNWYGSIGDLYECYGFSKDSIPKEFYNDEWDILEDNFASNAPLIKPITYGPDDDSEHVYPNIPRVKSDEYIVLTYPYAPTNIYSKMERKALPLKVDPGTRADFIVPDPDWR